MLTLLKWFRGLFARWSPVRLTLEKNRGACGKHVFLRRFGLLKRTSPEGGRKVSHAAWQPLPTREFRSGDVVARDETELWYEYGLTPTSEQLAGKIMRVGQQIVVA